MARRAAIFNVEVHHNLQNDLMEHIWTVVDHIDLNR